MKRSFITIALLFIFMLICIPVFAADVTTTITSSSATPKQGEVITVTIGLSNLTGSDPYGVQGTIDFDNTKLEYIPDSETYMNSWQGQIASNGGGFAIYKQKSISASETLFTLKYKVKDTASIGSSVISLSNAQASSSGESGSTVVKAAGSSVSLTIAESQNQQADQNNAVDPGSNQAADPGTNQATNSGSGTSAGGSSSGDTTKANKAVDKAGLEDVVTIAIFAVSLIGLVSYIKYRSLNF